MNVNLEARRAEISALCQRFNVRRLDLFGSAARGTILRPMTYSTIIRAKAYSLPRRPRKRDSRLRGNDV